jgi:hypothetical protein
VLSCTERVHFEAQLFRLLLAAGHEMQGDISAAQFSDQPTLCPGLILSEAGISTLGAESMCRPGLVSCQCIRKYLGDHTSESLTARHEIASTGYSVLIHRLVNRIWKYTTCL